MSASILAQEIQEQPEAVERLLAANTEAVWKLAGEVRGKFQSILVAARGTSDNAARYAQYLLGSFNRIPVTLATPSLFSIYQHAPNLSGTLVLGISQSGKSPDIVAVLAEGRAQGCPTVALTNDPLSPLASQADAVITLQAGKEQAVAATKTYTTSLSAVALLSAALAADESMLTEIRRLPGLMHETLSLNLAITRRMERYRFMQHGVVLGRGYNYATCGEVALKVMELTGTPMLAYSSADFMHGPVGIIQNGYPAFVVAHSGSLLDEMIELLRDLKSRGADLCVISDSPKARALADFTLPIPSSVPEWLSPVTDVLPGQILGWQLALAKGLDPDHPRGLHKVTETL